MHWFWIILIILLLSTKITFSYDSTDDQTNKKRSGLTLHTDHQTGCQYVGRLFGGVTPRLDKDGNHICIKE